MNTLLTSLVEKVYIETNRPDYEAETLQKVLASTLKMHSINGEFFFKDMRSAQLRFDSGAYLQTLDTRCLPRYRNMAYARKWDPTFSTSQQNPTILPPLSYSGGIPINVNNALGILDPIDPRDILDSYGAEKLDVYYQLGSTLMMKSSTNFSYAQISWYEWPDMDIERYSSWIASEFPYAIVYDAASAIFQMLGRDDTARKYDHPETGLVAGQVQGLVRSNILVQGS